MTHINKLSFFFLILFFFHNTNIFANDLDKLKKLFDDGLITEKEFKKAISIAGPTIIDIDFT